VYCGEILAMRLSYGDSTDLYRINLGWANQRGNQPPGFNLDLERGYWSRNQADDEDQDDANAQGRIQRVVPYVKDTKNALVVRFEPARPRPEMASLQGQVEALIVNARRRTDLEDKSFAQGLSRLEMIQVIWFVLPVVVLVVALGVVRGGIRRIRSLARTAEQIAAGDLSLKAGVRGSDEISGLGAAFDAMIATMKANIHKESDEKTRAQAVIDSTADGILTMNETGTILSINAAAEKLFGYQGEKVLGPQCWCRLFTRKTVKATKTATSAPVKQDKLRMRA